MRGKRRFGISLAMSGREPIGRIGELAAKAEQIGFDALWALDSPLVAKEVYVALAVAAQRTHHLYLGPGVTSPLHRHPVVTANAIAAIDELSAGRAMLGIGAGDSAVKPLGYAPAKIDQMQQVLQQLHELLRGETVAVAEGRKPVRIASSAPQLPVIVAASRSRMLRLAGEQADGVIVMGPHQPESIAQQIGEVVAAARGVGRDRSELLIDVWLTVAARNNLAEAVEAVRPWAVAQARSLSARTELPSWLTSFQDELAAAAAAYDFGGHLSRTASHKSVISDELATTLAIAGTSEECRQRITDIESLDVDRITVTLLPGDRERRLQELARDVLQLS